MKGQKTRTSPDWVRMEQNDQPLSACIGVVSGEVQSSIGVSSLNGRPQLMNVQTWFFESSAMECNLPQLGRVTSEGERCVADIHIDIRDCANGIRHEEPMWFRCLFILHREALAIESGAFSIQRTFATLRLLLV